MNWSETRKRLLNLATTRSEADRGRDLPEHGEGRVPAASLCVASGKGGTGKSVVSAALAGILSARGRTLLVDADLGVGNAHILQDVTPPRSFVDVVEGEADVRECIVACSGRCDLVAGGSGVPRMAELSKFELHLLAGGLADVEGEYRFLLVDSAAGVSRQTVSFARAADRTLVVTTPDLTAMTDAYAFLKVLEARGARQVPFLVVNRASSEEEALEVVERLERVTERFLGRNPRYLGWVPDDPAVRRAVNGRTAVTVAEPHSEAARALRRIAGALARELGDVDPGGLGRSLRQEVGYSRRI